jgi:hypothetical protein
MDPTRPRGAVALGRGLGGTGRVSRWLAAKKASVFELVLSAGLTEPSALGVDAIISRSRADNPPPYWPGLVSGWKDDCEDAGKCDCDKGDVDRCENSRVDDPNEPAVLMGTGGIGIVTGPMVSELDGKRLLLLLLVKSERPAAAEPLTLMFEVLKRLSGKRVSPSTGEGTLLILAREAWRVLVLTDNARDGPEGNAAVALVPFDKSPPPTKAFVAGQESLTAAVSVPM